MIRIYLFCLATLISACATTLETVYVPAEHKGWKVGYGENKPSFTLVEYVPTDESISNWSRIFTIQLLKGMRDSTSETANTLRSLMLNNCPDTKWNILVEEKHSVTYERITLACKRNNEYEIARLLKGNDGIHRISYTSKNPITETERAVWLKAFSEAYVEKGSQRVLVNP